MMMTHYGSGQGAAGRSGGMTDSDGYHGDILNEEDEVKVHVMIDIEEGELSSGEEGEIKDGGELSASHCSSNSPVSPSLPASNDSKSSVKCSDDDGEEEEEEEDQVKQEKEEEEDHVIEKSNDKSVKKEEERKGMSRSYRGMSVCRHFLQGKCSWGRECRFSHDERALSRPHPPLRGDDQFMGYLGHHEANFMRLPPPLPPLGSGLPHLPPPPLPHGARTFPPSNDRGGPVSQIEEESDGWYRLRTVADNWSSDNESQRSTKKRKRIENSRISDNSSESSGEEKKRKKKKKKKDKDRGSVSSKVSKKPRQKDLSNSSSDEEYSNRRSFSGGPHHSERYTPPFHPFGAHRPLPFYPIEPRPISMPPYHPQFPPPPPWSGNHLHQGLMKHSRNYSLSPKRRQRHRRSSSSPSPTSSPARSKKKNIKEHSSSSSSNMNRKQQLLQELSEIDKVIERKKKRSVKKSE